MSSTSTAPSISDSSLDEAGAGRLVLVTGANGWIAGFVIVELLQRGFRVRGTVRNPQDNAFLADIAKLATQADRPIDYPEVQLVAASLTESAGWPDVMSGVQYVIHLASPISAPAAGQTEAAYMEPAIQGALNVLRSAAACDSVKRVVLTSSIVSVMNGHPHDFAIQHTFTGDDWSVAENIRDPYIKSKTVAEHEAWSFIRQQQRLEMAVINPTYVVGPLWTNRSCFSVDMADKILSSPALPKMTLSMVDVRDVALAHVRAMTAPGAAGRRFLCGLAEGVPLAQMAQTLGSQGFKVPTMSLPYFVVWLASLFSAEMREYKSRWNLPVHLDNTPAQTILDMHFRPCEQSLVELVQTATRYSLIHPARK